MPTSADADDRKRMRIALFANLAMFATGLVGWYWADSASLLADAFDMLADASGYIVAMLAIDRTVSSRKHAARWDGTMLILLGTGIQLCRGTIGNLTPKPKISALKMRAATVGAFAKGCV